MQRISSPSSRPRDSGAKRLQQRSAKTVIASFEVR
jgi:hypothetical protein